MLKRTSLFIVCLLLLSTLLTAFHHHGDAVDHNDCPVCVAIQHQSANSADPFVFTITQSCHLNTYLTTPVAAASKSFYATANDRAPPA